MRRGKLKCLYPLSRYGFLPGFQHCPMNQLRWWKPNLLGSKIQTTTQRETPRVVRLSCDVSSINSNCWRTGESKLVGHPVVRDEYLVDLRLDTFCSQHLFNQLHGRRVSRTVCHVQDLHFHSALSALRAFVSRKIGQCADRLRSSLLQLRSAKRSSRSKFCRSVSLRRTSISFSCSRRCTGAQGCMRFPRSFKRLRISLSLNPRP